MAMRARLLPPIIHVPVVTWLTVRQIIQDHPSDRYDKKNAIRRTLDRQRDLMIGQWILVWARRPVIVETNPGEKAWVQSVDLQPIVVRMVNDFLQLDLTFCLVVTLTSLDSRCITLVDLPHILPAVLRPRTVRNGGIYMAKAPQVVARCTVKHKCRVVQIVSEVSGCRAPELALCRIGLQLFELVFYKSRLCKQATPFFSQTLPLVSFSHQGPLTLVLLKLVFFWRVQIMQISYALLIWSPLCRRFFSAWSSTTREAIQIRWQSFRQLPTDARQAAHPRRAPATKQWQGTCPGCVSFYKERCGWPTIQSAASSPLSGCRQQVPALLPCSAQLCFIVLSGLTM